MIDREGALEPLVLQVGVELRHLLGQHHALVDHAPARQRRQIQPVDLGGNRSLLDPAADDIQLALESVLVHPLYVGDQNLFDLGARRVGFFAQNLDVHRHVAPTVNIVSHPQDFGFHNRPTDFLRGEIVARQEDLAHGDPQPFMRFMPGTADLILEEFDRNLHVNARAVAGLAVGIDRAPVPDRLQRIDPRLDHFARPLAIDVDDKTDATGRMLGFLVIETGFAHRLTALQLIAFPIGKIMGHGSSPSTKRDRASYSARVFLG